ncbi:hypothetical protein FKP32DRAFT_1113653 [Trametes sanguinea]|nr:hypothetical protein FKP32DRAFT_1113653 [Trametes sanguinea]
MRRSIALLRPFLTSSSTTPYGCYTKLLTGSSWHFTVTFAAWYDEHASPPMASQHRWSSRRRRDVDAIKLHGHAFTFKPTVCAGEAAFQEVILL